MSISADGFHFERPKSRKGTAVLLLLTALEAAFSFFLYLAIAGKIFDPGRSEAAPGVPQTLSYQGRLTDTSGNPLGGAGQIYCFRYSLYDAQAAGNKIWPAGTPGTSTTTVADGVFSDQIGRVDALNLDMFATSTVFLGVEVNTATSTCAGTWEPLTPRQQLTASAYALASEDIYGNYLRTVTGGNTKIQIGTGAGVTSGQILLSLDVKNVADNLGASCTDNGSVWYNSANTRALICENGTIQTLSNSSTTIAGIGTNSSAAIISGSIVFSNSNGVTFGQNGSTITASVSPGGGATLSRWNVDPVGQISSSQQTQSSASFRAFIFPQAVTFSRIDVPIQVSLASSATANTGDIMISSGLVIYSRNASTLQPISGSFGTTTYTWASNTANWSNLTGGRLASFGIAGSLPAGEYWIGFQMSTANTSSIGTATTALANSVSVLFGSAYATGTRFNNFGAATANSSNISWHGLFSSTITATNQTIALSNLTVTGSGAARANIPVVFRNW